MKYNNYGNDAITKNRLITIVNYKTLLIVTLSYYLKEVYTWIREAKTYKYCHNHRTNCTNLLTIILFHNLIHKV